MPCFSITRSLASEGWREVHGGRGMLYGCVAKRFCGVLVDTSRYC